jgi:hypothetical protein
MPIPISAAALTRVIISARNMEFIHWHNKSRKGKSMKNQLRRLLGALVFLTSFMIGCAPVVTSLSTPPLPTPSLVPSTFTPEPSSTATPIPPTISAQLNAIEKTRIALELPELPLKFVEKTEMLNSPSGGLEVAIFQDSDGRKYSVDPETNQVVEIDARALLTNIAPNAPTFSLEVLRSKALRYFTATIPNFEQLRSLWRYEEGAKLDVYFFSWYDETTPTSMSHPFAQIGLHKSGLLFAYYNTLTLNK